MEFQIVPAGRHRVGVEHLELEEILRLRGRDRTGEHDAEHQYAETDSSHEL